MKLRITKVIKFKQTDSECQGSESKGKQPRLLVKAPKNR